MTHVPGIRPVDPDAEADRLARERLDPPGREWAIRHPGGKITVQCDGHAYPMRITAERERAASDEDCEWCDGGTHTLIYRDRQAWRDL
jgi:hypothetical protein